MTGLPTIQPAKTVEYETPEDFFDEQWEEVGGFNVDPFCRPHHYTARKVLENGGSIYVPPDEDFASLVAMKARIQRDGLAHPWHGKVWMNPPYGLFLRKAVAKAVSEVECGNVEFVMGLLPAKTEVQWWQKYVLSDVTFEEGHALGAHWEPPAWKVNSRCPLVKTLRFLPGRLHFSGGDGGPARVGNVLVVWKK